MSGLVAAVAGALTMATVLALAAAARPRRVPRRQPPAAATKAAAGPRPRSRRRGRWALFVAAFVTGGAIALVGVVPVLLGLAAALVLRHHRRHGRSQRRREAVEAAMPDAIEVLVLCVRAGCSPTQAVVELVARAPPALRPAFADVELRLHRGQLLADALGALEAHAGRPGREVARAIAGADRDGLPLAPVLDRLAADARTTRRRLGEIAARRLPVRLTFPLVMCTLPSFVLLAIAPAVIGALSTLRDNAP